MILQGPEGGFMGSACEVEWEKIKSVGSGPLQHQTPRHCQSQSLIH